MIKFVSRRPRWAPVHLACCAHVERRRLREVGALSVPAHPQVSAAAERTLFTDSTLFRRICMEADSRLTPSVGR